MAAPEEEVITAEQETADKEAYDAVFFGEDNGEVSKTTETEEDEATDQGYQESEGEPDGSEEDIGDQGTDEGGEVDVEVHVTDQTDNEEDGTPETVNETKFKIKWNGEDIEVTHDELIALGQKGFDYTAKMQNVSKYRKDLEEAGINENTIELMRRIKAGDKRAMLEYLNSHEVDPIDLIDVDLTEKDTTPPRKRVDEVVVSAQVAPLIEQVMNNPSLQSSMERAEGMLPNAVIRRMAQDPDLLYTAVSEVESGSFDQVMPRIQVRMASMSDLDREYVLNSPDVFAQIYMEEKSKMAGTPAAAPTPTPQRTQVRPNMAEVGIKRSNTPNRDAVIKDAFTDDDEYKKILNRVKNSR